MILEKYRIIKELGKGGHGVVYLVEKQPGKFYAIKSVSKELLTKKPHLQEYFRGEVDCLKKINSPYVMKLYSQEKDDKFYYLICEYCDGGDLTKLQQSQPQRVFTLEYAVQILTDVIRGIYLLHQAKYLHRDIKPQNIFIKNQGNKKVFKLGDMGFTKQLGDITGTQLGTQRYMAPQVYCQQAYAYQVDMWSFGVLFYFMLNMEHPFKANLHPYKNRRTMKFNQDPARFSYKQQVEASKKKLTRNCTKQVEDLFAQMFDPDPQARLTFSKIRQHVLFKKYFPEVKQDANKQQVFQPQMQSKIVKKSLKQFKNPKNNIEGPYKGVSIACNIFNLSNQKQVKQETCLKLKVRQIDFMMENVIQFNQCKEILKPAERYSLTYNFAKYSLTLTTELMQILDLDSLNNMYPKLAWKQFCNSNDFKNIKLHLEEKKSKCQQILIKITQQCSLWLKQIDLINPKFKNVYDKETKHLKMQGTFKESYRSSINSVFKKMRESIDDGTKINGKTLNYYMANLQIAYVYQKIINDPLKLEQAFIDYLSWSKANCLDLIEVRKWMSSVSCGQVNSVVVKINALYKK